MKFFKIKLPKITQKYLFWLIPLLIIVFVFGYKLNINKESEDTLGYDIYDIERIINYDDKENNSEFMIE